MHDAVVIDHLTKTYGSHRGITDLSLTIHQGEIFGLLGPNGAGKSTTIRTLTGLMAPTSGSVRIQGIDPHTDTVRAMAHIGNLPTEFSLDNRMNGAQFLDVIAKLRGISDLSYAHEIARRIDADLTRPMRRLSRGNKQKIGLVIALFHQPDVIVLDEPTGGLDPLVQNTVLELLNEARSRGQTILFSSHVLSEVEHLCDRIGIIREGELVAGEDPRALTGRTIRHAHVRFDDETSSEAVARLRGIQGVEDVTVDGTLLSFTMPGSAGNAVMAVLQPHPIASIDIERPSLDEIFLAFYGPSGKAA